MGRQHKYKSAWGTYVQYLLDFRGITHGDLADKLGMMQGTLSHYISGRSKPPLGDLTRWAEVLRCSHEEAERLSWLALEPWTPEPVWTKIRDLEAILTGLESTIASQSAQLIELRAKLAARLDGAAGANQ